VWRNGGSVTEVPIVFTDRVRGSSKMTWGIFAEELLLVTWWGVRDRVLRRGGRRDQMRETPTADR
jgi:dolichol-phosphate mannosyltransferase